MDNKTKHLHVYQSYSSRALRGCCVCYTYIYLHGWKREIYKSSCFFCLVPHTLTRCPFRFFVAVKGRRKKPNKLFMCYTYMEGRGMGGGHGHHMCEKRTLKKKKSRYNNRRAIVKPRTFFFLVARSVRRPRCWWLCRRLTQFRRAAGST